ncbi:MAG: ComF family protein [Deltaproteobacteria bacterium]|nr:ComF family protein [Deltaproteobacteria bacterium]
MKRIFTALAEVIFPTGCMTCGTVLDYQAIPVFCADCFSKIKFIRSPLCSCCGMPFEATAGSDHLCGDCIDAVPVFTVARSAGHYESVLLDAIHLFKYRGKTAVGKSLGKLMAEFSYPGFSIADYSLIIPVPLHVKRLRERGFNQSLILAREIARSFSMPLDFMTLKKHVHTDPQVSLGKKERGKNVRGAFMVKRGDRIHDEKIILVDDVYTTGSTLKECARVLKNHGARQVAALTLARAV